MKKKLLQTFTVTSSTLILPAAGLVPAWLADGDFQVQVIARRKNSIKYYNIFFIILYFYDFQVQVTARESARDRERE